MKFDLVRIGKKRKNYLIEKEIIENVKNIKILIKELLIENEFDIQNLNFVLIIPQRGTSIKIPEYEIKDSNIIKLFQTELPNNIYKGDYNKVLENIHNKVF